MIMPVPLDTHPPTTASIDHFCNLRQLTCPAWMVDADPAAINSTCSTAMEIHRESPNRNRVGMDWKLNSDCPIDLVRMTMYYVSMHPNRQHVHDYVRAVPHRPYPCAPYRFAPSTMNHCCLNGPYSSLTVRSVDRWCNLYAIVPDSSFCRICRARTSTANCMGCQRGATPDLWSFSCSRRGAMLRWAQHWSMIVAVHRVVLSVVLLVYPLKGHHTKIFVVDIWLLVFVFLHMFFFFLVWFGLI